MAGTLRTNESNALEFLTMAVPSFRDLVATSSRVLDFGCGYGVQSRALATLFPATQVLGVDLPRQTLHDSWSRQPKLPNLLLTSDPIPSGSFDIVFSCSSFEHFDDPEHILGIMRDSVRTGGLVIVAFAEPWFSPRGSHMDGFCRLPWVNLMFSERTIMSVRSRFRADGARRYDEVEGGLNKMTVRRFESIMRRSGMRIRDLRIIPVRRLPLVSAIPGIRELLTASCSCILEKV